MMKKFTKTAGILLCAAMILSSCSSGEGEISKESSEQSLSSSEQVDHSITFSDRGVYPIVSEPVTLKVFSAISPDVGDLETNDATKFLENKTNVKVEWQNASQQDAKEKISLMLASKSTLPDVFLIPWVVTPEFVSIYGAEGYFIPLNQLIEEHGVNVNKINEYDNMYMEKCKSADGNIYALYDYSDCYHCHYAQRFYINDVWLNNLGLEMPDTTEEFYQVLKEFKEKDANGNGDPSDEIPYAPYIDHLRGKVLNFIMNSFEYSVDEPWLQINDGKITSSVITDGWKEGLRYYRRLYDEGLMNKESFITTSEQLKVLLSDPKGNRVGAYPSSGVYKGVEATKTDYVAMPPLTGPTGLKQVPTYHTEITPRVMITKDCKIPKIAFKWADYMMTDLGGELSNDNYEFMEFAYGPENKFWRKATADEKGLDGNPAKYKWIMSLVEPQTHHWAEAFPRFYTNSVKMYMVSEDNGEFDLEKNMYEVTRDTYKPFGVDKTVPTIAFTKEESMELTEITTTLVEYINENVSKFITGTIDIDEDWDNYLNELDKIGVNKLVEIYQNGYDRQYKK